MELVSVQLLFLHSSFYFFQIWRMNIIWSSRQPVFSTLPAVLVSMTTWRRYQLLFGCAPMTLRTMEPCCHMLRMKSPIQLLLWITAGKLNQICVQFKKYSESWFVVIWSASKIIELSFRYMSIHGTQFAMSHAYIIHWNISNICSWIYRLSDLRSPVVVHIWND